MSRNKQNSKVILLVAAVLAKIAVACGPAKAPESETQGWLPWVKDEPVKVLQTESGDPIPERVANFLQAAEGFGRGVRTYQMGTYTPNVTDCSGFLGQAHRAAGHRVSFYQFDWDHLNFAGCSGQLRAGDVLLLAYPGRQPDHWVMMADVRAPNGQFNHTDNIIMDVSSDYVDGKPFFKGELGRRKNLLARKVYACRRHRTFENDWKQMIVQQEQAIKAAEGDKPEQQQQPGPTQPSNSAWPWIPFFGQGPSGG
ncbi:MAG: hypothetical protein EBR09_12505 [Proteobacteria bacterium]|nr:hypothetical protein [Pseudomonadota bacterium]